MNNKLEILQKSIVVALKKMHNDYKKNGVIKYLRTYDNENIITYGYLRKMIEMDILHNVGTSKKTSKYEWNGGDNPDYNSLALQIIEHSPQHLKPLQKRNVLDEMKRQTMINAVISITLRLNKLGMNEEEIQKEVPKLIQAFSSSD